MAEKALQVGDVHSERKQAGRHGVAQQVRVHSLRRGAAEALEVVVHGDADSSKVIGRRIEDISLPQGTTLGAVVRGEDVIIAHHDTTVQADDHLILFLTDRRHIEAVEKLFQGSASFL